MIGTDPLGLQVDVAFRDDRVFWISEIVQHACPFVLGQTGDPASPIYREKMGDRQKASEVNDLLVDLFEAALDRWGHTGARQPDKRAKDRMVDRVRKKIEAVG